MNPLQIDIVSDIVCPWCFIGKRHLEAALATLDSVRPVRIHWHPFQLNPDMPLEGMPRKDYLEAKFGGAARAATIYERVTEAGRRADIAFNFDAIALQPNTLAGHALIALAQDEGKGDAMVERLFRAYFLEGQFVGDRDVLSALAQECGLDETTVRAALHDETRLKAVAAQDAQARAQGVGGVPFFIFNQKIALSGAQPPEVMRGAIEQALSERANVAPN